MLRSAQQTPFSSLPFVCPLPIPSRCASGLPSQSTDDGVGDATPAASTVPSLEAQPPSKTMVGPDRVVPIVGPVTVVPFGLRECDYGVYRPPCPGTLTLSFSNAHSRFTKKHVHVRVADGIGAHEAWIRSCRCVPAECSRDTLYCPWTVSRRVRVVTDCTCLSRWVHAASTRLRFHRKQCAFSLRWQAIHVV